MPYCAKCGKMQKDVQFYTYRNGDKTEMCKKCLTLHVDAFNPDTFLWLLEKLDVPYIEEEWNTLRDKAYQKDPTKVNSTSVFGKYLAKMKLVQWNKYHWADTERIKKEKEEIRENYLKEHGIEEVDKKTLRQQYLNGEITESQYKTLLPVDPSETLPPSQQPGVGNNPFPQSNILDGVETPASQLTHDDKIALAMKWGVSYNPDQWIKLEKTYTDMMKSFDIQDADTKNTLIVLCKTYLKMNEAIDIGDAETYLKFSRAYDSLRKSSKFTAAQNKEEKGDFVDCIGAMVAYCEKEGGRIPRHDLSINHDIVDVVIKDMKDYTRSLVYQDTALAQQIENYIRKREAADQQRKDKEEAEKRGMEEIELLDQDYSEHYASIEKDKENDQKQFYEEGDDADWL